MQLDEFKNWLVIYCDAQNTIHSYFAEMNKYFMSYTEFTQENINVYLQKLIETGKSKSTFNQFLKAVKKYAQFSNITLQLPKLRKTDRRIKPYLSEKIFQDIFKEIPYITSTFEKWQSILLILFYCGLRESEIEHLTREDIDFNKLIIHVKNTKGKVDRDVPITQEIVKFIERYYFTEQEQRGAFNTTAGSIQGIIKTIKQNMSMKVLYPHLFRDACCRNWLEKGIPIHQVKYLMGHRHISTTELYCNSSALEAEQGFRKYIKTKI